MAEYTGLDKRLQYLFQHSDFCKVVSGYYYDEKMYKDSAHTELITGSTDCLYIDKSTTTLYLYNGSEYEEVQGGGSGSTVTITPTLSTGTKIADYSIDGTADSLYAPNGGSSSLDGLTDVTITSPTDGQALLYDSTTGEWVNGTVPGGGGGGSDGTAGVSVDISLGSGQSITYSRTDFNITQKGCYLFSITSGHNAWMEYLGYFFYGGHYPGYQVSGIFSIRSSYLTVSYADGQNGTFTITNTSGYGENQRIEILPIHPKIQIQDSRRYFDVAISASSSATYSLEDLGIKDKGAYFVSFVAENAGYANYLGVFMYSGVYNDWQQNNIYSIRNSNCTVSFNNTTGVFTFTNSTSYSASWRIEICPASPNIVETVSGASELSELSDVSLASPTDGQALIYDSTSGKWENGTPASGASSLTELADVTITTPSGGQMLSFDSTSNKWKNTDVPNSVVNGYYHSGDFYEDQSYTQIITGQQGYLYVDLNTTTLYLYDGSDYVEVQGGGSGVVSDGTVGVRIDKTFTAGESKTYTYDELGITDKGYYTLGVATNHSELNGGWKWYGYLCYSGNTTSGYSYVKPIDYNNISVTMNTVNKTITITNTNGSWAETFRIEILPLHPKVEIPKHTYSTTEQVVGTWIDGKPIYEITLSWNNTYLAEGNYPHGIVDIDECISAEAYISSTATGSELTYRLPYYSSYGWLVLQRVDRTNIVFYGNNTFSALPERTIIITLKYTKTTDA